MFLSVITPTYNRGEMLIELFQSLQIQTYKNFEWIVVIDGSTDNTVKICEELKRKSTFDMQIINQTNGGKHRALNTGILQSNGEYTMIVDDDDYLVEDAVEMVKKWTDSIQDISGFAGVSGLRGESKDKIIGEFPKGKRYIDATNLERRKKHLTGDKAEVYKTDILKQYRFPQFEDEKFLAEGCVWNHIAGDGYKIRWFGKIIMIGKYLPDGLTNSQNKELNNFQGFTYTSVIGAKYKTGPEKIMTIFRYYEIAKCKKLGVNEIALKIKQPIYMIYLSIICGNILKIVRKM